MKKKITLAILSITTVLMAAVTAITTSVIGSSRSDYLSKVGSCYGNHSGNHYAGVAPTSDSPGYQEFYVCCNCHEVMLADEPHEGTWSEAVSPDFGTPEQRLAHKAHLPALTYDEPIVLSSVDGGAFKYAVSSELGATAYNFKSKGTGSYEKLYLAGKSTIGKGTYEFSFDYAFKAYGTNEMWVTVYENVTGAEAYNARLSNSGINTKYTEKFTFTLNNDLNCICIMTSNVAGVVDMYLNHFEVTKTDPEPSTKPSSLVNIGDFALETFGDPTNKVLDYSNAEFNKTVGSFVNRLNIGVGQEKYINFNTTYTTDGAYTLDFDYWVIQSGSGFFYVELWCNGTQSDNAWKQVTDMTTGSKLHVSLSCNYAGKSVTTNFLKFHTYQATAGTEILIDNVKLAKAENFYCSDAAGGTCSYSDNATLGMKAYNLTSSGLANYEPFYFKGVDNLVVAAGSYTITFDYCFTAFNTNTVYFTIWDANNEVVTNNSFDVSLNAKHSYSLNFTSTANLSLMRIMTANAGVIEMSICNIKISPAA